MMITTRDRAGALLQLSIRDRNEVPVLMISGGGRLKTVLDDRADLFAVNVGAVEFTA